MVPWTFSLDSAHGLADFIEYHAVFLPATHVHAGYHYIDEHEVESLKEDQLLSIARQVGRETWATRQALKAFIEGDGAERERELLLESVRPSTAVLLARLWRSDSTLSVDHVLLRPEAAFALHDEEEQEIRLLRPEIWVRLWGHHAALLAPSRRVFEKEQAFLTQRLEEAREEVSEAADSVAEERKTWLQALEDRVFLRGERVEVGDFLS